MIHTFECPCGKEATMETEFAGSYNYGDVMKQTGFTPILTHAGGTIWICPECNGKARLLAKQLLKIIPDEHLYFPTLVREKRKS